MSTARLNTDRSPLRLLAVWLVPAMLVLLPVARTAEAPLALIALIGLWLAVRGRLSWDDPGLRLACGLFAAYAGAALVSTFAAVAPAKTWSTVASTLRFLPFAVGVGWALRDAAWWPRLNAAIAVVLGLWLLDAWLQAMTGFSLGGPADPERLSGVFGAGNLKLGPVLAVLSPFALAFARERGGARGLVLAFVAVGVPVLLSGARSAWLAYALVGLVFAWRQTRRPARFVGVVALGLALTAALIMLASRDLRGFDARIERSLLALQGTPAAVDEASAGRLSIWQAAAGMIRAQPLTGVGVRGFRHAYPAHATPGDRFVDVDGQIGAAHAHQIVLEVLSETGVLGLALWLAGLAAALRAWRRADAAARRRAFAPALALVAMCFPLNTHLAFYSAWWGLLFWWLLALYCAALGAREASASVDASRGGAGAR